MTDAKSGSCQMVAVDVADHVGRRAGIRLERDGHVDDRARPLLRLVADADDRAVRDVPDHAVDVASRVVRRLTPFDRARGDPRVDHVTDAELVLHQHEHAREEVPDERLRTEAERDAGDARSRDQRREVDPERLEDGEHRDRPDQDGDHAADHRTDGLGALHAARLRHRSGVDERDATAHRRQLLDAPAQVAHEARGEDAGDPHEDPRDQQDDDDADRLGERVGDVGRVRIAGDAVHRRAQPRLLALRAARIHQSRVGRREGEHQRRGSWPVIALVRPPAGRR